jgi:ATP-dependent helicase/nuclease subunit A
MGLETPGVPARDRTEIAFDPRRILAERLTGEPDLAGMDALAYQEARERFEGLLLSEYRFPAAASSAAKISVSELKRREQAFVQAEERSGDEVEAAPADWLQGTGLETARLEPDEMGMPGTGVMSGAERGTAIHAVLRYLDLRSTGDSTDANEIARQIRGMKVYELLTQREADAMEPLAPAFAKYVWSSLGRKVATAEKAGRVYREMPFTLRFDAQDIHKGLPASGFGQGDATLVQGIIDLWYEDPDIGGVVLVDFKSDKISGSRDDIQRTLEERYRVQMDHYTAAIERSTAQTVVSRRIWLFDEGCAYEIGRNADFRG